MVGILRLLASGRVSGGVVGGPPEMSNQWFDMAVDYRGQPTLVALPRRVVRGSAAGTGLPAR